MVKHNLIAMSTLFESILQYYFIEDFKIVEGEAKIFEYMDHGSFDLGVIDNLLDYCALKPMISIE